MNHIPDLPVPLIHVPNSPVPVSHVPDSPGSVNHVQDSPVSLIPAGDMKQQLCRVKHLEDQIRFTDQLKFKEHFNIKTLAGSTIFLSAFKCVNIMCVAVRKSQ